MRNVWIDFPRGESQLDATVSILVLQKEPSRRDAITARSFQSMDLGYILHAWLPFGSWSVPATVWSLIDDRNILFDACFIVRLLQF